MDSFSLEAALRNFVCPISEIGKVPTEIAIILLKNLVVKCPLCLLVLLSSCFLRSVPYNHAVLFVLCFKFFPKLTGTKL